ncbi:hypothetical protein [Flavobacterium sp. NKUCC04_CG]|uniref:hypothetical protein n=1 Tax=Flavobacterium sp. NKUCC04_CG TaxID=2842121 RepID=UPI001C5ABE20|nr:hypothetical protein [Flavobacterium sp. NKUCC04_CG]MBW3518975.1 flippase-like domain-containing protein [Flavobacterium sp. NKUCC04_CG]
MKFLSDKTKQFLVLLIKILVVAFALYFIYHQLSNDKAVDFKVLLPLIGDPKNTGLIVLVLLLTFTNRFVEILKWQNLAAVVQKISLGESTKQVLSALTLGLFTPNGIGEYAAKVLYFDRKDAGQILFLNVICNGTQVIYGISFGALGALSLHFIYQITSDQIIGLIIGVLSLAILLIYLLRNVEIKGYSIRWLITEIRKIPYSIHRKNLFLSFLRYVALMHQYIFLYRLFGVELPYYELLCSISFIYLLASSLPSFQFLEFAIKGSIALYIFNLLGVNSWIVALVAALIWLLNIVIPVLIGSYFVLSFKLKK